MPGSLRTTPQHIAAIGLTVDGREITEQDIDDIVETYNAEVYGARINLDHYGNWGGWAAEMQGIELNGCMLGDVISVAKGKAKDGTAVLTAILCPNESLLKLNQADQAVYYSIEINRNFMDTGKTYLTGLAMTDYPASTRTTRASFSNKDTNKDNKQNQLSEHKQKFELTLDQQLGEKQSSFKNIFKNLFASKKEDEMKPEEVAAAIQQALAEPLTEFSTALNASTQATQQLLTKLNDKETDQQTDKENASDEDQQTEELSALTSKYENLETKFNALNKNFKKAINQQADDTTDTDEDHEGADSQFGKDFL